MLLEAAEHIKMARAQRALYQAKVELAVYHATHKTKHYDRGCTGDFSKKNIFSNTFFSVQTVDMVCRMKSHQGRIQKKVIFMRSMCVFLCFFCFAGKNAFLDVFCCCFHCCSATCVAFRPPLFNRLFRAPTTYVYFYIVSSQKPKIDL